MYAVAKNEIHMDNVVLADSVLLQAAVFTEAAQLCISWIVPMTLSDPCEHATHIAPNRRNTKCQTHYVQTPGGRPSFRNALCWRGPAGTRISPIQSQLSQHEKDNALGT